ncbi:stress protein [Streptomyces paludis]|uniref:Stress protein n=2 Tax=Streptomyces paludis TaxID=2282738 RepID=A0A345HRT2_9ACTN|nr:stress protein [Streptomyces paludis]
MVVSGIAATAVLLPSATASAAQAPVPPRTKVSGTVSHVSNTDYATAALGTASTGVTTALGAKSLGKPGAAPAKQGEYGTAAAHVAVIRAVVNITKAIVKIITNAIQNKQNREGYVKSLREGAFYDAGQKYNVMIINSSNKYSFSLGGLVYDAEGSGIHGKYRILVFESGTFTNKGDGGYINWAFRGWFERNGMTVNFRRSW